MASYEWPPEGGGSGGVTSLNSETGAITVTSVDSSVVITPSGQTIDLSVASASGDVAGPASATDMAIARFNGTTGKLIQNSTAVLDGSGNVGFAGTLMAGQVIDSGLTVNTVPYTNASKQFTSSAVTPTELGYVSGVTSAIQTQLNSKGTGTVTAVSVATANGLAGTSSGGATPALTLTTSVNAPVLAGNGTAISAATTTGTGSTAVLAAAPTLTNPVVGTQTQGDASTKAASTAYVDTAVANAVAGVNPAVAVQAATTAAGDTSGLTYNNGASGIGATFTGTTNTALTVDGFTFTAVGQRILVKNDTQSPSGAFNGIYNVTQIQTSLLPPILTRALDYDTPSDMNNTGAIPVINGTLNGTTSWVLSSQVVTVGTTPLTFVKFSINPSTIVTAVSISSANGFAGSSSGGTTPALTISTSITGILKGNGTAISAATSGTDYAPATTGSTYLKGNGSGGFTTQATPLPIADTTFSTQAVSASAIDWSTGSVFTKSIATTNTTFTFSNVSSGQTVVVRITATTGTVTWPTVKWPGGTPPTQTVSGTDVYTFVNDGTNTYGSYVQAFA